MDTPLNLLLKDVRQSVRGLYGDRLAEIVVYGMTVSMQPYAWDDFLYQENAFLASVREDARFI